MQLVKCPICKGIGQYDSYSDTFKIDYPVKCTLCDGIGKIPRSGLQTVKRKQTSVDIVNK